MRNQRHDGPLAQLVEHLTLNQGVQSSILWRITIFFGRMVKRLRHRPFTAVSGVRFPLRSPTYGRLAQLGERLPYKQNVSSSILLAPTIFFLPFFAYNQVGLFVRRGVAQFGRAPALGAGGRRFKSCRSDQCLLCGCSSMVEP